MPQQWILYGTKNNAQRTPNNNEYFRYIYPTPNLVRMCGAKPEEIQKIVFQEDNMGEYTGWLKPGNPTPSMIQLNRIFPIQFPYGIEKEIAKGNGNPVKLKIISYTQNMDVAS